MAAATVVIAVHGAVANGKTWLPLVRLVPGVTFACPDLPGHGTRRDVPFSLGEALKLVTDLVDAARPRRPILVGDSLGGYIALIAARRLGLDARGVVAGGCTWSMAGAWGALARASDGPPRLLERALGETRTTRLAEMLVPRLTDAATARAVVAAGLRPAARSESLRELAGVDLERVVREIDVPIVFVNGAWDWPTRAGESRLLRAAREGSLEIAPGVGHGVGLLAPEAFARGIASIRDRTDASRERLDAAAT